MYDVEQFLREAGAERINEKAIISLERELEDTVNELVEEATLYANYAGRKKMINTEDIALAGHGKKIKSIIKYKGKTIKVRKVIKSKRAYAPRIMLVNDRPVVRDLQEPLQIQA